MSAPAPEEVSKHLITWARIGPGLVLAVVLGLLAYAGVRWVAMPLLETGADLIKQGVELERSRPDG